TDIVLQSGGTTANDLVLNQNLTAANSGDVRLISAGKITQQSNAITANNLGMRAGNTIDVTQTGNAVTTLAATASSGTVSYRDSAGFTVGSVAAQTLGTNVFTKTDGVTTTGTGTHILLQSGG